jgi:hypothetical protein
LIKASSLSTEDKTSRPLIPWLARLLDNMGQRLFAEGDARARQRGWDVTQRHGGLGRRYRDPRFGSLVSCPSCGGTGEPADTRCWPCGGTGRLTLHQGRVPGGAGHA